MDALSSLWFTSVVGAVGFTATGFFLARSRMSAGASPSVAGAPRPGPPAAAPAAKPATKPATAAAPEVAASERTTLPPPDVVPRATSPSMAPRRDPRREEGDSADSADNETDVLRAVSDRPKRAASIAPASSTNADQERQLHALRVELRAEVIARNKCETDARELEARLSAMAEQMTALRAARNSEDATIARNRESAQRRSSIIPSAASDATRTRLSLRAPGLFAEIDDLKADIARLTTENEALRAAALGAQAPVPRVPSARTDLVVPEVLKLMVDRIARLDNVRSAAVTETSGLLLAGAGEHADAIAAFGAFMTDAAARSTRLLPLRSTDEVTVRDSQGLVFSTRVLGRPQAELALVTLSLGELPARELRTIVAQTPGLDADIHTAR